MNYRRALLIRFGGVGDILLLTPSIRALYNAYPGIAIDCVVGGGMVDALSGHPCIRNIMVFDKRGADSRLDQFLPFLGRLSRERYDLVINLHPSAKSYLMVQATRAPHRIAFRKRHQPDPETGLVTHAIEDFAKELRPLGIHGLDGDRLDFVVPDRARDGVDDLLRVSEVPHGNDLVVINPAASRPINRWPIDRFKRVTAHFAAQPNTTVIVTGAPASFRTEMDKLDEITLANDVCSVDPRVLNLAGRLTLKELGAILERASAFLTCDTGPMHIGAAVGAPMVVISGAADPNRTGPRASTATVLIDRRLPCTPCRARICARGDLKCMDNIHVDAVIEAMRRHIRSRERLYRSVALPVIQ